MFKEVFEKSKSKDAHKAKVCSEHSLDTEKLWIQGKWYEPNAVASRVSNGWDKWESFHAHGRRLWSMMQQRLVGSRLYT